MKKTYPIKLAKLAQSRANKIQSTVLLIETDETASGFDYGEEIEMLNFYPWVETNWRQIIDVFEPNI